MTTAEHWILIILAVALGISLLMGIAVLALVIALVLRLRRVASQIEESIKNLDSTVASVLRKAWPAAVPAFVMAAIKKYWANR